MDVALPEGMEEMRAALRRFVRNVLDPLSRRVDETGEVPEEAFEILRRSGYLGMTLDESVGGGGMGLFPYCLAYEEFSRSHRIWAQILGQTCGLAPTAISRHGTPGQKEKYLAGLVSGRSFAAFGLTEPGAGSDSAAISTRAVPSGNGWIINGRKHFISGGHRADVVLVMAVTDPEKRARGGITAFLVDKGTPGFTVTRVEETIGSSVIKLAELTFEDCHVPADAVLGEVGGGFRIAMGSLTEGRLSIACGCIGAADRLIEMSVAHAKQRHTFGKPLAERQAIQWMLADSQVELRAARSMTYDVLRQVTEGGKPGAAASMCKLYASEMVGRVADRAVQIHGGMGLVRSYPVERFYRDIRHYRVGEGSSEVQRMLIARDMLGEARGAGA